jgi:ubiquinone biosynthesis protein UbiJ
MKSPEKLKTDKVVVGWFLAILSLVSLLTIASTRPNDDRSEYCGVAADMEVAYLQIYAVNLKAGIEPVDKAKADRLSDLLTMRYYKYDCETPTPRR